MKSHQNENIPDFWDCWVRQKRFSWEYRGLFIHPEWEFSGDLFPRKFFHPGMGQFPMEAPPGAQMQPDSSTGRNSRESDAESHQFHLEFQRHGGDPGQKNPMEKQNRGAAPSQNSLFLWNPVGIPAGGRARRNPGSTGNFGNLLGPFNPRCWFYPSFRLLLGNPG